MGVLCTPWRRHQELVEVRDPADSNADHVEGEHGVRSLAIRVEAFSELADAVLPLR